MEREYFDTILSCLDKKTTKNCSFPVLTRREVVNIYKNTVLIDIISLLEGAGLTRILPLINKLRKISFDDIYILAELLLVGLEINGTTIKDIVESDYFIFHPDELYIAIFMAIDINFLNLFFSLDGTVRFWPIDRGEDSPDVKKINRKLKHPDISLHNEEQAVFRVAKYYGLNPIEVYKLTNRDFLDAQEYMFYQEDQEYQINLIQNSD